MRKDFGAKPYTYPQPVLMIATYGEDGKPDVMNAAWGGISDDKEISICVSENHKTTENILKKGAFTVSMADVEHMKFFREIVNVSVDESVLDENGNVDVAKAAPITFDPFNNAYIRLGEKVGDAFKAGTALK